MSKLEEIAMPLSLPPLDPSPRVGMESIVHEGLSKRSSRLEIIPSNSQNSLGAKNSR